MTEPVRAAERHAARQAALQMLYQWEVGGSDLGDVLATYPAVRREPLGEGGRQFAETLVRGTALALERIDPMIADQAAHWRLERMAVIDRLILRLGIYEMIETDTPRAVIIDEALGLARTFSTDASVKFVNGVLDAVGRRLAGGERDR